MKSLLYKRRTIFRVNYHPSFIPPLYLVMYISYHLLSFIGNNNLLKRQCSLVKNLIAQNKPDNSFI